MEMNRFEAAVIRDAEAALSTPPSSPVLARRRESYVAQYGSYRGELLYEQDRRDLAERFLGLKARIDALNEERTIRRAALSRALAPLEAAMNEALEHFNRATAAYEAQRIANQSALMELDNEAAALMAELNRSAFEGRVKQWAYAGKDNAPPPPREIENKTVVHNINWQPVGEGSGGPREFWNTPQSGPERK